jgi:endo-1,4-beta-xylanase
MKTLKHSLPTAVSLLALAGAVVWGGTQFAAAGESPASRPVAVNQPLRTLAALDDLRIGTATDPTLLSTDPTYQQIVGGQFSLVTPGNDMKWQTVEPTQGTYDWTAADQLVAFAEAHGQLVRGHTLIWHNQLPTWLTTGVANGTITPDQLKALLHKHITDEVTHFKGEIWQWDVVNEAFNEDGTLRNTLWLQNLGPDYIADAFRWAHQADPKALLFINDYNIEGTSPKSTAAYNLVKQLRSEGVPIDGVGIQGHLGTQYGFYGADAVAANMARFTALGMDVAVTEADVRSILPMTNPNLQAEAEGYNTLMQGCLLTKHCISFSIWGVSDKDSWIPGVFPGQGGALLWDENYAPKPAYTALQVDLAAFASRHR